MWRVLVRAALRPRLRTKLALSTALATAAVLAGTAWLSIRFFRGRLLALSTEASSTASDALRAVLEEQMLANDRAALRRLVGDVGHEPHITWVALLDHTGTVRISSDGGSVGRRIPLSSHDCQVCHAHEPSQRQRSVTLLRPSGGVLRTVTPIMNRQRCHQCHEPGRRINGVFIVDRSLSPLQAAVVSSRAQVVAGAVAALVVLLGSLGLAIERLVLLRIERLRLATRELGHANLAARAQDKSGDELGELARDFNVMAARLEAAMGSLALERRQLDELVNGIADGLVLVDPSLRVVTTNRAFAARLPAGMRPEPGTSWVEMARAAGFDAPGQTPAERALESGRLEKEIVRVPGPVARFEEVYAQPLRAPDGSAVAVIEVWRDVTDRMALEAGLEHSERLASLGMLATGIAHEVGNPLASIATAVEGLLRRMDEPGGADLGELREYLEIVRKQVFRCRDVTERLLDFARVPSRDVRPLDAAAAAREVVRLVGAQARGQRVEVRSALDRPVPALAEELLLEQVLLNLTLNALRAMPEGGVLTVEARTEGDSACVVVRDTGPGIPPPLLRHLFDPLRRPASQGVHTGLGLFLSLTLVRRCGGTIDVASEPGHGASFTVRLPRPLPGGQG
jgi:C4-dicarboxylate-specific signal transduction histidine kinase